MEQDHLISNNTYNVLKQVVAIVLPALATLYFTMAQIWDWHNEEDVMATITAIATFLGVFLKISTNSWNNSEAKYDGELAITGNDEETGVEDIKLTINREPQELANKRTVRLRSVDNRSA